ncbi:MAG: hypothetical protein KKA62_04865 [Nanoarchaeota archaeon]|nr:hypothetical protein [Nanoarchaeota archaeon]MBU1644292.1 hypothetical protein [Nanoarchaeota archaeon]MBU1977252.1 hypothetical protein [Nanoarchaeota archaeon]
MILTTVLKSYRTVEFPEVNVDFEKKQKDLLDYFKILEITSGGLAKTSKHLVRVLTIGTENYYRFLGTTVYGYIAGLEELVNGKFLTWPTADEGKERLKRCQLEQIYLNTMVFELAKKGLIYGVVLGEEIPQIKEDEEEVLEKSVFIKNRAVLKDNEEMVDYFGPGFPREKVNQVIFIPNPTFTEKVWGFSYQLENLEKIIKIDW